MQVGRPQRRGRSGGARVVAALGGVAALLTLAACTSASAPGKQADGGSPVGDQSSASSSAPATPKPTASPAVITTSAVSQQTVNPATPVTISIDHGTLTSVVMLNPSGKKVTGTMSADGTSWHTTEDLGYSKTYSITATGKNSAGTPVVKKSTVRTVSPDNLTDVSLDYIGGYALNNGATYGVAIVPMFSFDEDIVSQADKLAAEKAIHIQTSPHVDGAFAWENDQRLYWRPQNYWPSGTKVSISADVYGVRLGNGLYGQQDKSVSFTIGRRQVTKAVDSAPAAVNKVRVYNAAGQVIRTMNTSMGEHSGVTVNGNYINFYTLDGTYTVLEHDNPAYMSSASYGLPASSPQGYASEPIYWSTKISIDGIYLHELNTTIWAQNSGQDVSHGCLNLDTANAKWFFQHSLVGDPVEIQGNKNAPKLAVWQGGEWSVPWSAWKSGDISKY